MGGLSCRLAPDNTGTVAEGKKEGCIFRQTEPGLSGPDTFSSYENREASFLSLDRGGQCN